MVETKAASESRAGGHAQLDTTTFSWNNRTHPSFKFTFSKIELDRPLLSDPRNDEETTSMNCAKRYELFLSRQSIAAYGKDKILWLK